MASIPVVIQSQGNDARPDKTRFSEQLKSIVGPRHVLTKPESTTGTGSKPYRMK
jgi:hypothetical protein